MSQKQAKRRRREQRAGTQQEGPEQFRRAEEEVRDLEVLLKSGDIDRYAQACWSLANRFSHSHKFGDEISLTGPCEEHGSHEYRFRLTLQSMMNIAQCADMETCGEAIRLVASNLPPEELPCYAHGHQDQFRDLILHGTRLHECIYCGETPKSDGAAKSIGWPSEIPIKGIDGQDYRTCPKCGRDMLELQGEKLDQWGWKIACLDCEWEIKQAELLDVKQYCDLMEQTNADLTGAIEIMESTSIGTETRIKTVAVQTRKILEDIAYAALVSNKDTWNKPQEELKDLRSPRDIFRDIGKIHPNFFPTPVEIREPSKGKPFTTKTEGVLNREKLLQIYRELNPLAHSRNPLDEPTDLKYYEKKLPVWLEEIINTLATHQVMLLHHPDHFYIVKMKGDRDGSVQCTLFAKDATGMFTCAWPDCVSGASRQYCEFWGRPWSECNLPEKEPAQTLSKMAGSLIDEEETEELANELISQSRKHSKGSNAILLIDGDISPSDEETG